MVSVKRLVLDILKPHQPNALDFSRNLANVGTNYHVSLTVMEMDENTETVQVTIDGDDLDFESIQTAITNMSGSLHSIDEVEVVNDPENDHAPG